MFLDLSWEAVTGLYAVHYLARRQEPVPTAEIARHGGLSSASLSKVLQRLRRGGIVRSERGRGFSLARAPHEVSVLEVVRAIEGPIGTPGRCLMKNDHCAYREVCPVSRLCGELSTGVTMALDGIRFSLLPVDAVGLPVCMEGRKNGSSNGRSKRTDEGT